MAEDGEKLLEDFVKVVDGRKTESKALLLKWSDDKNDSLDKLAQDVDDAKEHDLYLILKSIEFDVYKEAFLPRHEKLLQKNNTIATQLTTKTNEYEKSDGEYSKKITKLGYSTFMLLGIVVFALYNGVSINSESDYSTAILGISLEGVTIEVALLGFITFLILIHFRLAWLIFKQEYHFSAYSWFFRSIMLTKSVYKTRVNLKKLFEFKEINVNLTSTAIYSFEGKTLFSRLKIDIFENLLPLIGIAITSCALTYTSDYPTKISYFSPIFIFSCVWWVFYGVIFLWLLWQVYLIYANYKVMGKFPAIEKSIIELREKYNNYY